MRGPAADQPATVEIQEGTGREQTLPTDQCSVLSTQYSVLSAQYTILGKESYFVLLTIKECLVTSDKSEPTARKE